MDKISIITVVYNDVDNIRNTIESSLAQNWGNKEYIIIDGGSTDGTKEIIEEYANRIAYFCSEPDNGIYDAMNKAIRHSTGDWIIVLNSGDCFYNAKSLSDAMSIASDEVDIIYGDSVEDDCGYKRVIDADPNPHVMSRFPAYRHGSSLVRGCVHRKELFDLSRKDLGYALDWELIHRLYEKGYVFKKADCILECYKKDGVSNHEVLNRWYNYKITGQKGFWSLLRLLKNILSYYKSTSLLYKFYSDFRSEYLINSVLPHIPFWCIRKHFLIKEGLNVGKGTFIMKNTYFQDVSHCSIGEYSHINRGCLVDARGSIHIGDNVSISHNVSLVTGGHDHQSSIFAGRFKPIVIEDYVWVGIGAIILQGVHVGKGAVVCAGAVVNKDVGDYEIVAGIPARKIGVRNTNLSYHCCWETLFT